MAVADREAILIHPEDAKSRNITNGDLVRAFNDRGQILVGAIVSEDVRQVRCGSAEGAWLRSGRSVNAGQSVRTATSTA
ncbi:Trimethylamine-N-oxide reductase 2 precursor [Serratia fonticola]|uniref:Trimethylamine-N-oxide reductase 2 n=1 Tax=Serratia fonticola TaxID=47917 RepID=A0A4U9UZ02_SERFO|nr:Trimethylamine-N-oxide reductase 2 precursor [Serratia fonticola]